MQMDSSTNPVVTAVLVLYRMQLHESRCYQSLVHSLRTSGRAGEVALFVYDNSPDAGVAPAEAAADGFPGTLHYRHDPANGGVAAAYNAGLAEARHSGSVWLLLLDQDTELTREYVDELLSATHTVPGSVVAIVPRLLQNGLTHSPQNLPRLSHRPLGPSAAGLLPVQVTAFNSGAALRVAALDSFPARYWLDFLDHAVFHGLQAAGGRIWLLRAALEHHLSTEQLGVEASVARYRNVLLAERDFYREYGSVPDRVFYHLRRGKQTVGHMLKVPDKQFALLSLRAALGLLPRTPPR